MGDRNNHKRKWVESVANGAAEKDCAIGAKESMCARTMEMIPPVTPPPATTQRDIDGELRCFSEMDEYAASVVPPVTVVMDGRSICQRIDLCCLSSYESFARALRRMFVDNVSDEAECTLSNAIPGYMIAFEDFENDLLLVGDLDWRHFVREAKRIRILPVKKNSQKLQSQ